MPFISREDQVHPCHMSPGRHGLNVLLKTVYDEDATTFPANLFLTRIFLTAIRPVAFFPIQYGHDYSLLCVCLHVFMYRVFSVNSSADYTMLFCSAESNETSIIVHTSTGAWVHIDVCIYLYFDDHLNFWSWRTWGSQDCHESESASNRKALLEVGL